MLWRLSLRPSQRPTIIGADSLFSARLGLVAYFCFEVDFNGAYCEGFRVPAHDGRYRALRGPAYENLQGKKPREWKVWTCGLGIVPANVEKGEAALLALSR